MDPFFIVPREPNETLTHSPEDTAVSDPDDWIRIGDSVFQGDVTLGNGLGSHLAQLMVWFFLKSDDVPDGRRRVHANVEPDNAANLRLYDSFRCRTEGEFYQRGFVPCAPTANAKQGWLGFVFPGPAPAAPQNDRKRKRKGHHA